MNQSTVEITPVTATPPTPWPRLAISSTPGLANRGEADRSCRSPGDSDSHRAISNWLTRFVRLSVVLLSGLGIMGAAGCVHMKIWERREPSLSKADPPLEAGASSEEILARVNQNAYSEFSPDGLRSYRCDDVRVRMQGVPAPMRASIVVEAPRNLRLRVANPLSGGEAVDIGSNDQEFWFWAKDSKPANVLVCAHDQIAAATQVTSLPLPFRPDWLMEVLGVAPISGVDYEVRRAKPKSPIVELVSVQRTPDQQPVRRIVKVNMMYGVALEHRVESIEGKLIAKATLSRHFRDPKTQLILPRQIAIDWPAADQQLALSLEFMTVDFNPEAESVAIWQVPRMDDYPEFDLGEYAMTKLGRTGAGLSAPTPRNGASAGSATLDDDLEVIEEPSEEVLVDDGAWSDEESLEAIERPIRSASAAQESQEFAEPASEIPAGEFGEESAPAVDDANARPFPKGF